MVEGEVSRPVPEAEFVESFGWINKAGVCDNGLKTSTGFGDAVKVFKPLIGLASSSKRGISGGLVVEDEVSRPVPGAGFVESFCWIR